MPTLNIRIQTLFKGKLGRDGHRSLFQNHPGPKQKHHPKNILKGDDQAMTTSQIKGATLFFGKARLYQLS